MAFAIFYAMADLVELRDGISSAAIPQDDQPLASAFWEAGVKNCDAAPLSAPPYSDDPDCRTLVIDGAYQGDPLTLDQFRELLSRLSASLGAPILGALSKDMGGASGAVEPWTVA